MYYSTTASLYKNIINIMKKSIHVQIEELYWEEI